VRSTFSNSPLIWFFLPESTLGLSHIIPISFLIVGIKTRNRPTLFPPPHRTLQDMVRSTVILQCENGASLFSFE
jgi:hypothetical protein